MFTNDPRCAGLPVSAPSAAPGAASTFCAANGASPPGFCGVSLKPDNPAFADEPIGDENAARDEPMIIPANINNIG
jgi:hypothetical protein